MQHAHAHMHIDIHIFAAQPNSNPDCQDTMGARAMGLEPLHAA